MAYVSVGVHMQYAGSLILLMQIKNSVRFLTGPPPRSGVSPRCEIYHIRQIGHLRTMFANLTSYEWTNVSALCYTQSNKQKKEGKNDKCHRTTITCGQSCSQI